MNGGGPEFFYKSRLPSIRLKVPSARRKPIFRSSPDATVVVILLNGQRVNVECHIDSSADDVFQVVTAHTNVMESHFFGLTYLKDGEHFFLESEQKLAKFAPPGWRSGAKDTEHPRGAYLLYFRLKFYPVTLDFVKTEQTLHQIYLQLRRDVIDDRLQCNRETSFVLAALALQAEYGDRTTDSVDYFELAFYLADTEPNSDIQRLRGVLSELHGQYAGLRKSEAEMEYIRSCQTAREYGIHFHRIYRTKPSQLLTPSPLGDPDTGTPLWIGIMPRGVIIFEERSGERIPISQHPWHMTQTLQFDHKRFVIVPQVPASADRTIPRRLIFFTDGYRKSCYFVNFAAAQHRFCMRMRFWASTLPMMEHDKDGQRAGVSTLDRGAVSTMGRGGLKVPSHVISSNSNRSSETDSGISREASPEGREIFIGGEVHRERSVDAVMPPARTPVTPLSQLRNGTLGTAKKSSGANTSVGSLGANEISLEIPTHGQNSFFNFDETVTGSLATRLENASSETPALSPSDYEVFTVKLYKDPQTGLGLTLVDGEIQGLKGVYVKLLTAGGPAELEGRLRIGDKIISINGRDLESKTRHDAVQLVRMAEGEVEIGILRLKSLYSSNESIGTGSGSGIGIAEIHHHPQNRQNVDDRIVGGLLMDSTPKKEHHQQQPQQQQSQSEKRGHRKASKSDDTVDFGKYGVMEVEDFLEQDYKSGGVLFKPDNTSKMYLGLGHDSEEDEEKSERSDSEETENENGADIKTGKKNVPNENDSKPTNGAAVVLKNSTSDEDADEENNHRTFGDGNYLKIDKKTKSHGDLDEFNSNQIGKQQKIGSGSRGDIDWTNDLMNSRGSSIDSLDDQPDVDLLLIEIVLAKNEHGSLGIQVAGGRGSKKVYVKALVAEPALSCSDILPGDQLASVNGVSTLAMSHADVVTMLKNATSPVSLGLLRPRVANGQLPNNVKENATIEAGKVIETLDVSLEKPSSGSLGLSLAKPKVGTGIYIRQIAPGSAAALDGRLKEGDRLWKINGELVAQSTPEEVVDTLKAAQGYIHLVVRREVIGQ